LWVAALTATEAAMKKYSLPVAMVMMVVPVMMRTRTRRTCQTKHRNQAEQQRENFGTPRHRNLL